MLEFLENIQYNIRFLEIKFEGYPFQIKSNENKNMSIIFDKIIACINSPNNKNDEFYKSILDYDDNIIKFKYCDKNIFNIYRNPLSFQVFYESSPYFKVYESEQLLNVLFNLEKYYHFIIDNKCYNSNEVFNLKKENKLQNNVILLPYITDIYYSLCNKIKFDNLQNFSFFNIKKEVLEPFFLFIEQMEITNEINYEKMKNFSKNSLNENLTFIMNKERLEFIKALDEYIKVDIQKEPMIIIGNDGVGKTLTLQLYSIIESYNYRKLYLNLKLLDKINPRNYFLIELMKWFISNDNTTWKENFKKYINCIDLIQDNDFSSINNIFHNINQILIRMNYNDKFIIILDQFNFEKISIDDFKTIKNNITKSYLKLIICCSLNDDQNKINLFSDYNIIELNQSKSNNEISNINDENIDNIPEEIEEKNDNGINLNNFYLIKKRKRTSDKKNQPSIINDNEKNKNINKSPNDIKINIENNENDEKEIETKGSNNKYRNIIDILPPIDYKNFLNFNIQMKPFKRKESCSDKKLKVYYSHLISLEEMLYAKNESENIINCMSEFNFIPKYYNKFNIFKQNQNLKGGENIDNIIKLFYDKESLRIKNNIEIYNSKMNLANKNNINRDANIYQNILKLKRIIAKTYEKSISFSKLYKYILKYPFKYVNILEESEEINDILDIKFDKNLINKKFKLRYSFPFVEKVIDKMIKEYDNDKKIDIKDLSGSAYGNALELKISENLACFKQKIEIRKVWSLDLISNNVKKEKLKEIEKEKKFNRISKFEDLEDITEIKEFKNQFNYFKPENQDNKLFDSIFLVKNINEFYIIALQITKNKNKNKIKSKNEYAQFLKEKIKNKFEQLYKIKISKIYFWFILSNETEENESLCSNLDNYKIKYAFYSIDKKCFFKKRNISKIENIDDFMNIESQVFPLNDIDDNIFTRTSEPIHINLFENMLYDSFEENNNIIFENIRKSFFHGNFGPKLEDDLKKNIIKKLKDYVPYNNEFEILFIYSFPAKEFYNYQNIPENDEFVYLFKIENKVYILFKDKSYEICLNSLKKCSLPNINLLKIKSEEKYNKNEFELSLMEDIYTNPLIYLYKIYYLGDELFAKKKRNNKK